MTVMTRGMMSSDTDEWATPQDLFDKLIADGFLGGDGA